MTVNRPERIWKKKIKVTKETKRVHKESHKPRWCIEYAQLNKDGISCGETEWK